MNSQDHDFFFILLVKPLRDNSSAVKSLSHSNQVTFKKTSLFSLVQSLIVLTRLSQTLQTQRHSLLQETLSLSWQPCTLRRLQAVCVATQYGRQFSFKKNQGTNMSHLVTLLDSTAQPTIGNFKLVLVALHVEAPASGVCCITVRQIIHIQKESRY